MKFLDLQPPTRGDVLVCLVKHTRQDGDLMRNAESTVARPLKYPCLFHSLRGG